MPQFAPKPNSPIGAATPLLSLLCELRVLCGELLFLAVAIFIETTRRATARFAFRHRRGYRYQVVRTNCYLSRPAMIADAENLAGCLAGLKGNLTAHASFSGDRSRPGPSPDRVSPRQQHRPPDSLSLAAAL